MAGNESFFGYNIAGVGEWGKPRMSPKPIKKLSLGAESYVTITWKGFFTQSRVLLASIVWNWFLVIQWNFCHLSLQRDGKAFALELSKCSTVVFSIIFFEHSWWSVCHTKELWTRCQECSPLTFSQWQKELKAIIWTTSFSLCVFKAFNADSTCNFTIWECALRRLKWDFLKTRENMTFFIPFFFFKYFFSTQILWRIAWPISSYL